VDAVFDWLAPTLPTHLLLPSTPFTQAARYALERAPALRVFREDPTVPLATTQLARDIRAIALGRRNWVLCSHSRSSSRRDFGGTDID